MSKKTKKPMQLKTTTGINKNLIGVKDKPIFKRLDFKKGQGKKPGLIKSAPSGGETGKTLLKKNNSKTLTSASSDGPQTNSAVHHNTGDKQHPPTPSKQLKTKWLNQCFNYQKGKCLLTDCRYFHISPEDKEFYKKTGEVPLNIIDQALRNDSYSNYISKNLVGDIKPPCKNFLNGSCSTKDCPFRHIARKRYEKQIYDALKHQMDILLSSEKPENVPSLLDMKIVPNNFDGNQGGMVDCREEINRRKLSKLVQSSLGEMFHNERIVVDQNSFPQNPFNNNFVNEFDPPLGYNVNAPLDNMNYDQLKLVIEKLQNRNELLLSELSKTNEIMNINAELKFDIEKLHEQNGKLLDDLRNSNETLRINKGLREEIDRVENKNANLLRELAQLNENRMYSRDLQIEVEKLRQENHDLSTRYNASTKTMKFNRELQTEVQNLRKQNENLQTQNETLLNEMKINRNWEVIFNQEKQKMVEMQNECSTYMDRIKSLEYELRMVKEKLAKYENYEKDVQDKILQIENQLYFVEKVTAQSWGGGEPPMQNQREEWTRLRSMVMFMRDYRPQEVNYTSNQSYSTGTSNFYQSGNMNMYQSGTQTGNGRTMNQDGRNKSVNQSYMSVNKSSTNSAKNRRVKKSKF